MINLNKKPLGNAKRVYNQHLPRLSLCRSKRESLSYPGLKLTAIRSVASFMLTDFLGFVNSCEARYKGRALESGDAVGGR